MLQPFSISGIIQVLSELFGNNIERADTIMTKKDQSLEQKKHDMSVRSINFSRYLMIRYFSAAFLFTNLFWLVFAICYKDIGASIISGLLFVSLLVASVEQVSKWNVRNTDLKFTKLYYQLQLGANVIFAIGCYLPFGKLLFPFMTTNDVANVIVTILVIGMLGSILILRRISNIQNGRDKYARAIKTFESNRQ